MNHKWEQGAWIKKDPTDRYYTREDICTLCGCMRTSIRMTKNGEAKVFVTSYDRSKQIFGPEHMPSCWGGPNPT